MSTFCERMKKEEADKVEAGVQELRVGVQDIMTDLEQTIVIAASSQQTEASHLDALEQQVGGLSEGMKRVEAMLLSLTKPGGASTSAENIDITLVSSSLQ